jgi:hypothetical protein
MPRTGGSQGGLSGDWPALRMGLTLLALGLLLVRRPSHRHFAASEQ